MLSRQSFFTGLNWTSLNVGMPNDFLYVKWIRTRKSRSTGAIYAVKSVKLWVYIRWEPLDRQEFYLPDESCSELTCWLLSRCKCRTRLWRDCRCNFAQIIAPIQVTRKKSMTVVWWMYYFEWNRYINRSFYSRIIGVTLLWPLCHLQRHLESEMTFVRPSHYKGRLYVGDKSL